MGAVPGGSLVLILRLHAGDPHRVVGASIRNRGCRGTTKGGEVGRVVTGAMPRAAGVLTNGSACTRLAVGVCPERTGRTRKT